MSQPTTDPTILLIGAGHMGGALLKGWLAGRRSNIRVVDPAPSAALEHLAADGKIALAPKVGADELEELDAAVLAIKPQIVKTEITMLQHLGAARPVVVSIAAGITSAFLRAALGPSCDLVRAMPNLPGAIGRGLTALHTAAHTADADRALAENLMRPLGETIWVDDEGLIDAITATSGSGPAYVFYLAECLAAAAAEEGFAPDVAAKIARATITGAGALLDSDPRPAAELRRDVTSPGGTTEAALKVLAAPDGLEPLIKKTVAAARARAEDLGKG